MQRRVVPIHCCLLLASFALASDAAAQCQYEVIAVAVPRGATSLTFNALSNNGHAAGWLGFGAGSWPTAAQWSETSGLVVLPTPVPPWSAAYGLSGNGFAAGFSGGYSTQATLWIDGVATLLAVPPTAVTSEAWDVNAGGVACGYYRLPDSTPIPVIWQADGTMVDMAALLNLDSGSVENVNDAGQVLVSGYSSRDEHHAVVWSASGVVELPPPPATPSPFAWFAADLSENGYVTGHVSQSSTSYFGAFLFDGAETIGIATPPECARLKPFAVNSLRQVLAYAEDCGMFGGSSHAVLWQDGEMHKLTFLLESPFAATISSVHDINDRGEIAARGLDAQGHPAALILRPIRTRSGDVNIDCRVDGRDITKLLEFWGATYDYDNGPGDLNGDRSVDGFDLAMVLGDWDA